MFGHLVDLGWARWELAPASQLKLHLVDTIEVSSISVGLHYLFEELVYEELVIKTLSSIKSQLSVIILYLLTYICPPTPFH